MKSLSKSELIAALVTLLPSLSESELRSLLALAEESSSLSRKRGSRTE